MKKLWAAVIISLLLNLAIAVRVSRHKSEADFIANKLIELILVVNFKIDALQGGTGDM